MGWKTCLIRNQILSLFLVTCISSCSSGPQPKWDGKLYAGDSKSQSMKHAQSGEECKAGDPCFDKMMGITYSDFRSFYETYVLGCKQWRSGMEMMSAQEAYMRFSVALKDLQEESK